MHANYRPFFSARDSVGPPDLLVRRRAPEVFVAELLESALARQEAGDIEQVRGLVGRARELV